MHRPDVILEFLLAPKRAEIAKATRSIHSLDPNDERYAFRLNLLQLYIVSLERFAETFYAEFRSCALLMGEQEALSQFEARFAPTFSAFSDAEH